MSEAISNALVRAAQAAGAHLKNSNGRKDVHASEKKARDSLIAALRSIEPRISVWGEDSYNKVRSSTPLLVVCPLDTIVNFSRRMDYGLMAAYSEDGVTRSSVIYLPETDRLYLSEAGKGVRLNGTRMHVSQTRGISDAIFDLQANNFDPNDRRIAGRMRLIDPLQESCMGWRNIGSPATAAALMMEGRIDAIVAPSADSMHAALYLSLKEAGATVTDWRNKPVSLHSDTFLATSTKELHEVFIQKLSRAH